MMRKAKALGVAVVAALGLGAAAAPAALAVNHAFSSEGSATVTVAGLTRFDFKPITGGKISNGCNKTTMEGEIEGKQSELILFPTFGECTTEEEGEEKFSMGFVVGECSFRFFGETTGGNPTEGEHANVNLECPEGPGIETRITALQLLCSTIEPQAIEHAARYENQVTENENTHVRSTLTAHGVRSTIAAGVCGEEETLTNGSVTVELTFTAHTEGEKEVSISLEEIEG